MLLNNLFTTQQLVVFSFRVFVQMQFCVCIHNDCFDECEQSFDPTKGLNLYYEYHVKVYFYVLKIDVDLYTELTYTPDNMVNK